MVLTSSCLQEPHPPRLSAEEAATRLARLDTNSPSIFQNLNQLKAFFAEVRRGQELSFLCKVGLVTRPYSSVGRHLGDIWVGGRGRDELPECS